MSVLTVGCDPYASRWRRVEPPMSCIMDACSKTRVVGRDGSLLYELPLSK
jgi:hypothetical protein